MPPTTWPTWVTVWSMVSPMAVTLSAAVGETGWRAPPPVPVAFWTVPPTACVVSSASAAESVTDGALGVDGVGGVVALEGDDGDAGGDPPEDDADEDDEPAGEDAAGVEPPPPPPVPTPAPVAGVCAGAGAARASPPDSPRRAWDRRRDVRFTRCARCDRAGLATGTAGSVVTDATRSAAVGALTSAPPPSRASSVTTPSPVARMPGQPWNASPADSTASTIPPAAMIEPEAPAAAAKARKKRIPGPHRPGPNDP